MIKSMAIRSQLNRKANLWVGAEKMAEWAKLLASLTANMAVV